MPRQRECHRQSRTALDVSARAGVEGRTAIRGDVIPGGFFSWDMNLDADRRHRFRNVWRPEFGLHPPAAVRALWNMDGLARKHEAVWSFIPAPRPLSRLNKEARAGPILAILRC
jgi:hypothetical protein